ncbi:hypothetical protein PAHAL_3G481500 [Panicum hallii]|uniref:Uncharacterized protein n=1 Tax=Panicum hallii TaxID=206008 RepID=A0A2T8KLV1_9POAL|nr:hypothetical protein PAHAL_3G481500 [Panicum hallii]
MGDAREAIVEPAKGADLKHVLFWYLKLLCRFHPFERIKEISFGKLFWHFIYCKVR